MKTDDFRLSVFINYRSKGKMKVKTLKKSKNPFVLLIRDIKKQPAMYLMILPVVIYYILFHYKPMYGLLMAFQDYSPRLGISGSEWVGFRHFKTFFNDIYFFNVLKNTLVISFSSLIFGFPMPIILHAVRYFPC